MSGQSSIKGQTKVSFLCLVTLHIKILFLYYFKYCDRLFYSHLAFLVPDKETFSLGKIFGK